MLAQALIKCKPELIGVFSGVLLSVATGIGTSLFLLQYLPKNWLSIVVSSLLLLASSFCFVFVSGLVATLTKMAALPKVSDDKARTSRNTQLAVWFLSGTLLAVAGFLVLFLGWWTVLNRTTPNSLTQPTQTDGAKK